MDRQTYKLLKKIEKGYYLESIKNIKNINNQVETASNIANLCSLKMITQNSQHIWTTTGSGSRALKIEQQRRRENRTPILVALLIGAATIICNIAVSKG